MKNDWDFGSCARVLTGEIELLRNISAVQDSVKQAVMKKEWADFDALTAEMNNMGAEFAILEEERARLFSALDSGVSDVEKPFYALVSKLPLEESRELARLYRELKTETFKIRALNESFLAYLNEARTIAGAYLEAVCPARGGKLYTRGGRKVSQDLRSMVFNNSF